MANDESRTDTAARLVAVLTAMTSGDGPTAEQLVAEAVEADAAAIVRAACMATAVSLDEAARLKGITFAEALQGLGLRIAASD